MDTSNPVITGERVTLGDFQNDNILLKRQNYDYIKKLVVDGKRVQPNRGRVEQYAVDDAVIKKMVTSGHVSSQEKLTNAILDTFLTLKEKGVLVDSYHPTGVNQKGAYAHVQRLFPQRNRVKAILEVILKYNPLFREEIEKVTYTSGTPEGFVNRLKMWAVRKPKPMNKFLGDNALSAQKVLKECLPVNLSKLVDWTDDVGVLLKDITVTKSSSAGPPFYKPKYQVMDEIQQALSEIVQAISDGTIESYFKEHEEMLIGECKNKMDRYDMNKVHVKTRPYFSFSSPVCFLISVIAQNFCGALKLFSEEGSNAYGFSWAHGGGERIRKWMVSCKKGEMKFIAYGDDIKLVYRDSDGVLWEVNPDFVQMDGSIDKDTVTETLRYIDNTYTSIFGESKFFKYILNLWRYLAIDSSFLVHGSGIWTNGGGGLRTGVVGTTLFDTAKSVMAYSILKQRRMNPIRDASQCIQALKEMGLEVKEGTWDPQKVEEQAEAGDFLSEQKFLGAQLFMVEGKEGVVEPVPRIPPEDLAKLMGNVRQQTRIGDSHTEVRRRLFDTARGYMITGAYLHPDLWAACCDLIDSTPGEIVVQRVQSGGGTGEKPEHEKFVGEDFEWPSSDGFPSQRFCLNVYLSENAKVDGAHWITIFPDLQQQVEQYRKEIKFVKPVKFLETKSWAIETEMDRVQDIVDEKVQPEIRAEGKVLTNAVFKPPRGLVKFKEIPKTRETKLDTIKNLTENAEEFHGRTLEVVLPYGAEFIAESMVKLGFYNDARGFWTRDATKKAKFVTNQWSYGARNYLTGIVGSDVSSTVPSIPVQQDVEGISADAADNLFEMFEDRIKEPPPEMNDVSWVSALFGSHGYVLETANHVISQSPARVRTTVKIKGDGRVIGFAVDVNAKTAKARLMSRVRRVIESFIHEPVDEKNIVVNEAVVEGVVVVDAEPQDEERVIGEDVIDRRVEDV